MKVLTVIQDHQIILVDQQGLQILSAVLIRSLIMKEEKNHLEVIALQVLKLEIQRVAVLVEEVGALELTAMVQEVQNFQVLKVVKAEVVLGKAEVLVQVVMPQEPQNFQALRVLQAGADLLLKAKVLGLAVMVQKVLVLPRGGKAEDLPVKAGIFLQEELTHKVLILQQISVQAFQNLDLQNRVQKNQDVFWA